MEKKNMGRKKERRGRKDGEKITRPRDEMN